MENISIENEFKKEEIAYQSFQIVLNQFFLLQNQEKIIMLPSALLQIDLKGINTVVTCTIANITTLLNQHILNFIFILLFNGNFNEKSENKKKKFSKKKI